MISKLIELCILSLNSRFLLYDLVFHCMIASLCSTYKPISRSYQLTYWICLYSFCIPIGWLDCLLYYESTMISGEYCISFGCTIWEQLRNVKQSRAASLFSSCRSVSEVSLNSSGVTRFVFLITVFLSIKIGGFVQT